jgi:hypothetical protein
MGSLLHLAINTLALCFMPDLNLSTTLPLAHSIVIHVLSKTSRVQDEDLLFKFNVTMPHES